MAISIKDLDTSTAVIAGDWHGHETFSTAMIHRIADRGHKVIIHVGDLGLLWPVEGPDNPRHRFQDRFTANLVKAVEERGLTFIFIDGNHDNHTAFRALPLNEEGFGVVSDQVLYAPRGLRWTLGGKRFGALGGAFSIDRAWRRLGESWWLEETTTRADVERLGRDPLDVLITHEVPAGIDVKKVFELPENLEREASANRLLVLDGVRNTNPDLVFSGHWHQRLSQRLPHHGASVHVLDREGSERNLATLDLETMTVTDGIVDLAVIA
ncbi:metallophosphoesterase [Arthrobacter sp. A2-55]|uniref:metallophosphoesterase family protein n=1 Tax=Arthrobacter sp. A2-55 TaxID=2897337 RepID=UPI0021CDCEAA|nr:metallophosphoesterase [Arthrobacter sp. A2-55]MCU6481964.1 metallophosphoesterase [Arthrobacter sp. A2-55]